MQIIYKELNSSNAKECLDIFIDTYATQTLEDYPELVDGFRTDALKGIADVCEALEYGVMSGKVSYDGDEIIGFILITNPNYIRKLAVKPEYQKKGIATKLIDLIEDDNIELVVHATEKVIPFYQRCGFLSNGEMNRNKYPYLPMKRMKMSNKEDE